MGVVYKLKPEIIDYILKKKQEDPNISCRRIAPLVLEKFQFNLSKSSINSLIKKSGLSLPVGRRPKKKRARTSMDSLGIILLKAADHILGGTQYLKEAIKKHLPSATPDFINKTEASLYSILADSGLVPQLKPDITSEILLNQRFTPGDVLSYLNELQGVRGLQSDIAHTLNNLMSQQVRCLKVLTTSGHTFYLDGQLHTVWSTPHIPYDFSTSIYNIKGYVNKYFKDNQPLPLFMAPGDEIPTKEFFDFIFSLDKKDLAIQTLILYNQRLEDIETIPLFQPQKYFFILGLWPWQLVAYRRIKTLEEFKPFNCGLVKENLYITEAEVSLSQPYGEQWVTLRGYLLKSDLNGKVRLVILTNLSTSEASAEEVVRKYLSRWMNLEEAYQDFNQKLELFTYTAASQQILSTENWIPDKGSSQDLRMILGNYIKTLDFFVRRYFLPHGYEEKNFLSTQERFYCLKGQLKKDKDLVSVTLDTPSDYAFIKDLEYACRRINEKEIESSEGVRLWFKI